MSKLKKLILSLAVCVCMMMATVVGIYFNSKTESPVVGKVVAKSSDVLSSPDSKTKVNIDKVKYEQPDIITYKANEISVQKGTDTINYNYSPSVDSKASSVVAYEYIFLNPMDETTGVNLKSIDNDDVTVTYAYSTKAIDVNDASAEYETYSHFTTQKIDVDKQLYVYVFVTATDITTLTNFSSNVWFYYGIPKDITIVNNVDNTTQTQTIISGQYVDLNTFAKPTAPTGYYFDAYFADKDYTQIVRHEDLKVGQTIYARFANLPVGENGWLTLDEANDVYCVTRGTTELTSSNLVIPNIYNDKEVTSVFSASEYTSGVFYNQTILQSVDFPSTFTSLGNHAFRNCSNLSNINFKANINLSNFGAQVFRGCSSLSSANLSNCKSINSIDLGLFYDCTSLTDVVLPDNLPLLGGYMFRGCTALTNIDIPSTVSVMANYAFYGCSALTSINLGKCTELTRIEKSTFYGCSKLETVTLPSSMNYIGYAAFANCSELESINLFECKLLSQIDEYAFQYNTSLKELNLSSCVNLSTIGKQAFVCTGLVSVDLSGCTQLKSLEQALFADSDNLYSVKLPASLTNISDEVFNRCESLTAIEGLENCNKLTVIGMSVFSFCSSLIKIELPVSIKILGAGAFYGCERLERVENFDKCTSLQTIENELFSECTSLTTINIPEGVTSIGRLAFENCSNLDNVVLPSSLIQLAQWAFNGCQMDSLTFTKTTNWERTSNEAVYTARTGGEAVDASHLTDPLKNGNNFSCYGSWEPAYASYYWYRKIS